MSQRLVHLAAARFVSAMLIVGMVVSYLPAHLVAAATTNKLYVTPASSQMNIGTSFPVNVSSYAITDVSNGSVRGTLTYPIGQLKVTSITVSGSAYGSPTITPGSGVITFSGTRSPAPSGIAQIFTVTFQAIGAGTAAVGFGGNSQVNNETTQYASGVYTITDPNPAPNPKPKPSPSSAPKPASVPSPVPVVTTPVETPAPATIDIVEPQPTPDPTGLIDSVTVDPLFTTGTINWKVNAGNPVSSLAYGTSSTQLDKTAEVTKNKDGTFSAKVSGLSPGQRYFYTISASGGGKDGIFSGTILTRGYPITMSITENNVPVKSGQVKLGDRSYPIGSDGKISIGLASGNYSGTITTDTASLTVSLTVEAKTIPADGSAPELQTFGPYNLTSSPLEQAPGSGFSILGFIGVLLGGTAVLAVGFVGFMAYRRRKFESGGYSQDLTSTVIVEDGFDWQNEPAATPNPDTNTPSAQANAYEPPPATVSDLPQHNNSVHLSEEEPLDMFERAANLPLPPASSAPTPREPALPGTGQSPNLPRSTTL